MNHHQHHLSLLVIIAALLALAECQLVCKNGGVPVYRPTGSVEQVCICHKDYIGPNCETKIKDLTTEQRNAQYGCAMRPCWIGSTCEDRNNTFVCHCSANTYGRYCEQSSLSSSPCDSKPCYNDGQCIRQDANSYTCQCGASNGGQSCKQSLIGACASNPCQRDGICVPIGLTDYKCNCPDWTIGKSCELVFNPCNRVTCANNGVCLKKRTLAYECNCTSDYTGLLCDQAVDLSCKSRRCVYGSCELNDAGRYACACSTPGYVGDYCEIQTCNPGCQRGTCMKDAMNNSYCSCYGGYKGAACSEVVCFSGDNLVETLHKGSVKISELEHGDMVKTFDPASQQTTFTKFINYLHLDRSIVAEYIAISTSQSTRTLKISPLHLIPRLKRSVALSATAAGADDFKRSDIEFVFARDLALDDALLVDARLDKIVKLDRVREEGAYAPLTESGTLIVNDFYASCYANTYSHDLAHLVFQPIRLWSRYVSGLLRSTANDYLEQLSHMLISTEVDDGGDSGMFWYAKALLGLIRYVPHAASLVRFA